MNGLGPRTMPCLGSCLFCLMGNPPLVELVPDWADSKLSSFSKLLRQHSVGNVRRPANICSQVSSVCRPIGHLCNNFSARGATSAASFCAVVTSTVEVLQTTETQRR